MKTLRQSVAEWCFFRNQPDPAAYYRALRDLGFAGVEMVDPSRYPLARAADLQLVNATGTQTHGGLNRVEGHAQALVQIRRQLAVARECSIAQLIVFAGQRQGQPDEVGIRNCIAGLKQVAAEAERAKVTLVFEVFNKFDHPDYQADYSDYAFQVVRGVGSPAVEVLYDIYHMHRMGEDVADVIVRNIECIAHLHVAGSPKRDFPGAAGDRLRRRRQEGHSRRLRWLLGSGVPPAGGPAGGTGPGPRSVRIVRVLNKEPNVQPKITVGANAGDVRGPDNRAIQIAVDALPAGGGTVEVLPGEYTCYDAVHLRSGVRLTGSGEKTILRNCPGFCTSVRVDADYGQYKVSPRDVSGFQPGMRVYIRDDAAGGWLESTATIERIENDVLHLDRHLMMDYAMARNATVSNAGALVSAIDAVNVRIENLTVDGNRASHQKAGGCRVGGVYLHRVKRAEINNVLVRDFAGDGISFQITRDVTLSHVRATRCANYGIHPGTGSARVRMTDCDFSENDVGGYFLCWRVQESTFQRLRCVGNGKFGISIGHKDTDNTFLDCLLRDNGEAALVFRGEIESNGAHRNTWRNCELAGSPIAIVGQPHVHDNTFETCRIGERCNCAAVLPVGTKRFVFRDCTFKAGIRNESGPDAGHTGLP